MSEQIETHETCCKIPTAIGPCPVCGNPGRKVSALTLDHHVPSPLRTKIGNEATFCLNPDCDVVYCDPGGVVIHKGETLLPVTIKDSGDDVFVCYCFEHTRGDIRRELEIKNKTNIPDQIKKDVQAGRCDCERKNPQGVCCLGNVEAAIKAIQAE
jgi:hypothetical protein